MTVSIEGVANKIVRLTNITPHSVCLGQFEIAPVGSVDLTVEEWVELNSKVNVASVAEVMVTWLSAALPVDALSSDAATDLEVEATLADGFEVTSGSVKLNDGVKVELGTASEAEISLDLGTLSIYAPAVNLSDGFGSSWSIFENGKSTLASTGTVDINGSTGVSISTSNGDITINAGGMGRVTDVNDLKVTSTGGEGMFVVSATEPVANKTIAGSIWVDISTPATPAVKVSNGTEYVAV